MLRLVIGFLPWIILGVLGESRLFLALILALLVAAVTSLRQLLRRAPKILDTVTLVFFALMVVGIVICHLWVLAIYMSLLVNVTLTAIAWGSLALGAPFTIQYAREEVPSEYWQSPIFLRINQFITAAWGTDFLLSTLISIVHRVTGTSGFLIQNAWVVFAIPAGLFTVYFPPWYRRRAVAAVPQERAPTSTST
jgi:all-trans-retinol 13,14-reductase